MKGGRSVIPVIDKKTERSYTESTSLLKNKKNQEVIMKKYTKLISAVLAAGLLAGILVFPGAAWEDKVSPWAVEELREAVALGLKNENFCDRINSRDDIDRFHFACEAGEYNTCQLRLSMSSTPL